MAEKIECEICNAANSELKIFEDEKAVAFLAPHPTTVGHIQIVPKAHLSILEQIPDFEIGRLFQIANKISIAVFESLGMQGTNILVQNGIAAGQKHAHFIVNIIPRRQDDGLSFDWKPKQLGEEEMSTVELKIKEAAKNVGNFEQEAEKPIEMDQEVKQISDTEQVDDEQNYLLKQLRRMP